MKSKLKIVNLKSHRKIKKIIFNGRKKNSVIVVFKILINSKMIRYLLNLNVSYLFIKILNKLYI